MHVRALCVKRNTGSSLLLGPHLNKVLDPQSIAFVWYQLRGTGGAPAEVLSSLVEEQSHQTFNITYIEITEVQTIGKQKL